MVGGYVGSSPLEYGLEVVSNVLKDFPAVGLTPATSSDAEAPKL